MTYLLAFAVSLVYILLKATQQRQVMAAEYRKMPAVSMLMAFCEVFIVANVARTAHGYAELALLAFGIGAGGGIGSVLGTYLHARKR
jgi:branched-subunit amino acid transport protein AzlD